MALKVLISFATTYECETAFSILFAIKRKSRKKLIALNDMRLALAKTKLSFWRARLFSTIQLKALRTACRRACHLSSAQIFDDKTCGSALVGQKFVNHKCI